MGVSIAMEKSQWIVCTLLFNIISLKNQVKMDDVSGTHGLEISMGYSWGHKSSPTLYRIAGEWC